MRSPRRLLAGCLAVAVMASFSVASAAAVTSVDSPARVSRRLTASRVDPPPYIDLDPDARAAWEVVDLVNSYRRTKGLPPLARHGLVTLAAERHAFELAQRGTLSHVGRNGSSPTDRLAAVGFLKPAAENLGSGSSTPQEIVRAWLNSPTHAANFTVDFTYIGVGVRAVDGRTPYWVLMIAAG